jgi:hypothetical protein
VDALSEHGAPNLLYALEYIPLAITQAAAYINQQDEMTAYGYLDTFQKNNRSKENLLNHDIRDLWRDESASNSIVMTWQISFKQIYNERRSTADLLSLMSCFNP